MRRRVLKRNKQIEDEMPSVSSRNSSSVTSEVTVRNPLGQLSEIAVSQHLNVGT